MSEYRVNLDVYNGPLDLLLYLIRRDELDIYDIPISRITEQYLQYVQMLQQLDPNLAGDFLVLAATLMETKTRMLLPSPPPEEAAAAGVDIDPRAELVRQLLQYKAFKDAAAELADAAVTQSQRFPRQPADLPAADPTELDMEDVQLWDLLDAFNRIMDAIGQRPTHHEVIYDDTPVELHASDILDRLGREGPLSFERIFEGRTNRSEVVGLFLALLELVRQRKIQAQQEGNFAQILVRLRSPDDEPAVVAQHEAAGGESGGERSEAGWTSQTGAGADGGTGGSSYEAGGDEAGSDGDGGPQVVGQMPQAPPDSGDDSPGTYISESEPQGDDDERGTEASGTGS